MPLMEPGLTLDIYREVLSALAPILRTWETWSAQYAPPPLQALLASRRRSHLLDEDLEALNDGSRSFAASENASIHWGQVVGGEFTSGDSQKLQAAFLGVLYVLEGSTLGGRLIARHVEPALGLINGRGDAYFRGHGEATGALWRETAEAIAAVPDVYAEVLIAAALRTFEIFRAAMGKIEPVKTT